MFSLGKLNATNLLQLIYLTFYCYNKTIEIVGTYHVSVNLPSISNTLFTRQCVEFSLNARWKLKTYVPISCY